MRTLVKHILISSIFLFSVSISFSTPLNGTYTIGGGGTYPTISAAFDDAVIQGVSGPVIFDVISGIYNEEVFIDEIAGSNEINTVTLKSQTENPADVLINGINYAFRIKGNYIVIKYLSIGSSISTGVIVSGENISFMSNDFNSKLIFFMRESFDIISRRNFNIIDNVNIGDIEFIGSRGGFGLIFYNIKIIGNSIGIVKMQFCSNVLIEKNTISVALSGHYLGGFIKKNKITGLVDVTFFYTTIVNNFISGRAFFLDINLINNTIVGGNLDTPTVRYFIPISVLNNVFINPSGGTVFETEGQNQNFDYNNFYNGGNPGLIKANNTFYDNVTDYSNAALQDEHSNSWPVTFVSPTDFHLSGSSLGDEKLQGIPNVMAPDDIDNEIRNPMYPYKGADEVDMPLPVELYSFISKVSNNNVQLSWITLSEVNNSGFDIERSAAEDQWTKAGFVQGNGNSSVPKDYTFTDRNLAPGKYKFRLRQIDFNGSFEYYYLSGEVVIGVPDMYELSQNYPNPFNPVTNLEFGLSELGFVSLKVYDALGREIISLVNEIKPAGRYRAEFDGSNFASGVYFYELRSGSFVSQKRMLLLK